MADHNSDSEEQFIKHKPKVINGRFSAPWTGWFKPKMSSIIYWMFFSKDNSSVPDQAKLDETLPIKTPKFDETIEENSLRVTWIGHATVLVEMDGVTILTDPIFSQRCSPVQFVGSKRYRPPPCEIKDLPSIDIVLISHDHYDHLDLNSVTELNDRFGDKTIWFVPKGLADWMNQVGVMNVHEMTWWDEKPLDSNSEIKIVSFPSQHWCRRGIFDMNKVLWCSWGVIGPRHRFYFAGDTGYPKEDPIFKTIGNNYGPFDLAAIPIGAYDPRWFMHPQHVDPEEAVKIHRDVKAKFSVGIHWGTFTLTNEHYLEPKTKLSQALKDTQLTDDDFFTLNHGASKVIKD